MQPKASGSGGNKRPPQEPGPIEKAMKLQKLQQDAKEKEEAARVIVAEAARAQEALQMHSEAAALAPKNSSTALAAGEGGGGVDLVEDADDCETTAKADPLKILDDDDADTRAVKNVLYDSILNLETTERAEQNPLTGVIQPSVTASGTASSTASLGAKEESRQVTIAKHTQDGLGKAPGGAVWGSWCANRPWLKRRIVVMTGLDDAVERQQWGMFCSDCEKQKSANAFTREGGCTTFKLDAITRHEKTGEHQKAAAAPAAAAGYIVVVTKQIVLEVIYQTHYLPKHTI
jgi:hypothetical protein